MGLFGFFSRKEKRDEIKKYIKNGALILDVRTQAEWDEGHIEVAKHIVLHSIPENIELIKGFQKPIIAVCKSGGRSQSATDYLSQNGLDVINGGPWENVAQLMG